MMVRFKSRAVVDAATVAKEGDELDIAIPLARDLVARGIVDCVEGMDPVCQRRIAHAMAAGR